MKNIMIIILTAIITLFQGTIIGQSNDINLKDSIEEKKFKNLRITDDGIYINFQDGNKEEFIKIDDIDIDIDEDDFDIDIDIDDESFHWDSDDDDEECDDDEDYEDCDDDEDNFRMLLLDLGMSSFMYNESLNLPAELDKFQLKYPGSVNVNLHIFRHRLNMGRTGFHLDYGVSVNWKQYKFQDDFRITPEIASLELVDSEIDFKTNKLRTTYLELPISLTYKRKGSKFFMSAGAYGFTRIGSSQKLKSEDIDTEKIRDDFNLRPFGIGLQGRIGFGPLEFYAQYALDPMFNDGITPELRPVTFGIAILGF